MRHFFAVARGMVKRSAAMSVGNSLVLALAAVLLCVSTAPGQAKDASSATLACDTIFTGPPGAPWQYHGNWSNGIPRPGTVACFPDAVTAESVVLPDSITVQTSPPLRQRRELKLVIS